MYKLREGRDILWLGWFFFKRLKFSKSEGVLNAILGFENFDWTFLLKSRFTYTSREKAKGHTVKLSIPRNLVVRVKKNQPNWCWRRANFKITGKGLVLVSVKIFMLRLSRLNNGKLLVIVSDENKSSPKFLTALHVSATNFQNF